MRNKVILVGAAAIAALLFTAGCGNSGETDHPASHATTTASAAADTTPQAAGQDQGPADVWFARNMIPHHQQAVEMSDIVLAKQGIDPRVVDLANEVKAAQGPEIQQMQTWLQQWGDPPMPATPPGAAEHGDHGGGMSGMLTERELTALREAQGVDACRMFLTQMIAHHEGAIAMAQTEVEEGQFAPAVELARTIAATQQREIDNMRSILDTL